MGLVDRLFEFVSSTSKPFSMYKTEFPKFLESLAKKPEPDNWNEERLSEGNDEIKDNPDISPLPEGEDVLVGEGSEEGYSSLPGNPYKHLGPFLSTIYNFRGAMYKTQEQVESTFRKMLEIFGFPSKALEEADRTYKPSGSDI